MAEITVLQLMDIIEKNPSINNYQSRWRELRDLLEKQALNASQHRVQSDKCPDCGGSGFMVKIDNRKVSCSYCDGTGICR